MNHSVTRLFADTLDHYFSPYARKLSQSPHLIALRDGFQISMPFVFIGCIFVPLVFPLTSALSMGETSLIALWWESLSRSLQPVILPMYQITLGLVAMIISFGISASLAKQYRLPERLSGLTGCLAFLMLSGFSTLNTQELYYLGGGGIFTALVAGIYAIEVINMFIKKGWYIHMPDDVPLITAQGFKLLIPIFVVFLTLSLFDLILKHYAGVHFPHLIETLFKPLILASDSLAAVIISILVCQLLWFVGIHGSIIITSIMNPFWMTNLLANQAAIETGVQIPPHIYTASFWDFFLLIGGVGSTLPLVYLALKSRSNHMKSVGKVALLPAIFNINEPILFGFPIIMNPVFILPFIFVPILNATIAWYLTSIGVLDRIVMMLPWTVPAPLGATWAANGSIANVLMVLFALVNSYCLYLPFFRAHEKIILAQQEQMAAQKH
ncbi:PTS sugar transporter subunit IIC [Vibrio gazogenes]|uniref:Permease IIC component n=1 Tax=Vibrio gazogenes DSM 21264 = NBRC 103151 TaxID=1123492 RepID=A0A1M5GKU6_VIBGA|nr:PTS transporter subunit EIIC [Vibrio gazogenes]USP13858.1 PTS transporter subunit EIIC [Vibrio gazogenes]SHG04327.1 PTS system, cellobiose-specific IIC component [Vibrio gazogenes DSM 21264] [Vibrio gazogenes DSM 21264 = NBRC 103151]SJN53264.1 Lichenan permease IIC component [Vibrio gazogenes]